MRHQPTRTSGIVDLLERTRHRGADQSRSLLTAVQPRFRTTSPPAEKHKNADAPIIPVRRFLGTHSDCASTCSCCRTISAGHIRPFRLPSIAIPLTARNCCDRTTAGAVSNATVMILHRSDGARAAIHAHNRRARAAAGNDVRSICSGDIKRMRFPGDMSSTPNCTRHQSVDVICGCSLGAKICNPMGRRLFTPQRYRPRLDCSKIRAGAWPEPGSATVLDRPKARRQRSFVLAIPKPAHDRRRDVPAFARRPQAPDTGTLAIACHRIGDRKLLAMLPLNCAALCRVRRSRATRALSPSQESIERLSIVASQRPAVRCHSRRLLELKRTAREMQAFCGQPRSAGSASNGCSSSRGCRAGAAVVLQGRSRKDIAWRRWVVCQPEVASTDDDETVERIAPMLPERSNFVPGSRHRDVLALRETDVRR